MHSYQSLDSHLSKPHLHAELFFQNKGIAQQILNNPETLVAYCRRHPTFAKRMITLALDVSYKQLQDLGIKTASHAVTEVICSEEAAIADLFFQESSEAIPDESVVLEEEKNGGSQGELQRHQMATLSLQVLTKAEPNETCLGYLQKLFAFFIRHDPQPVLHFFSTNPNQLHLLLNNLRYYSVSSMVAQLLTSEDRTKVYKHEQLKKKIVRFLVSELFHKIEDWQAFDGIMVLVEEILNTTKQFYYEFFEDFKRAANILVQKDVLQRFLDIILQRKEPSFRNASLFLEILFSRINTEGQDNRYYHGGEEAEPSMNFQIDAFFQNMPALIQLVAHIDQFSNLTKISYLSFLDGLLKCSKTKKHPFSLYEPAFIKLLESLNRQSKAGVYRIKLYNLILAIIQRSNPQEISHFLQQDNTLWTKYFVSIRDANYFNTKVYNMNESSAFDVAIIHQLGKKDTNTIQNASQAIGKDFKRICKKYDTKIASFQNKTIFSGQEQFSFQQISPQKFNRIPTLSLDFINKNIVIALPNHVPVKQNKEQQQSSFINGIRQVQQIEQVVFLTDKINTSPSKSTQTPQNLLSNDETQTRKQTVAFPTSSAKETIIKLKEKVGGQVQRVRYFAKHLSIFG